MEYLFVVSLCCVQVANCAPTTRPREQVAGSAAATGADQGAYRRTYRWSTGCSVALTATKNSHHHHQVPVIVGDLMRFLPSGGVDARGRPNDPDSEYSCHAGTDDRKAISHSLFTALDTHSIVDPWEIRPAFFLHFPNEDGRQEGGKNLVQGLLFFWSNFVVVVMGI